jgi:CheY-like chemotaxis protein
VAGETAVCNFVSRGLKVSELPIILGVDENRDAQADIAQAFNRHGVAYRFISDRKKLLGGLKQLKPTLLTLAGDLSSDLVLHCLDAISRDVTWATLPVVVFASDVSDREFVSDFRCGVVGLLPTPFADEHVERVTGLFSALPGRQGTALGTGASREIERFIEHVRRTRRTGMLKVQLSPTMDGRVVFANGKMERARIGERSGPDALRALAAFEAPWQFSELSGPQGDGVGVVIEVGDTVGGETEVAVIASGPANVPSEANAPGGSKSKVSQAFVQPSILLVDDDEAILRMFSTLFSKRGFVVSTATDGEAGAQMALSKSFDLVMTDLNMPHLDGWGMLRMLRDDLRTREVPVAFISAHDDYREALRAVEAGAQAFLSKGTRLEGIVEQVRSLLAPRAELFDVMQKGQPFEVSLHAVGPQWFLTRLTTLKCDGVLRCKDGWSEFTLTFSSGHCVHASAVAGKYAAEGERAFNAFVASRSAVGTFSHGARTEVQNLIGTTQQLIERACATLNQNEAKLRDQKFIAGAEFEINQGLYEIFRQVGPEQWLGVAKMICEDKVSPKDIIERLDVSPIEVEETLKDLVRRGVVNFKKK